MPRGCSRAAGTSFRITLPMGNKQVRHWSDLPGSASGLLVQLVTVMVVVIGVLQIKAGLMDDRRADRRGAADRPRHGFPSPPPSATRPRARLSEPCAVPGAGRPARDRTRTRCFRPGGHACSDARRRQVAGPFDTFAGSGAPSLSGLTFSIREGERVALIGKSGSGKSTLLQLLAGLIPAQDGLITLDGHALERFAIPHLRRHVIYSAQDAAIFEGTIWHNILLGMEEPETAVVDTRRSLLGPRRVRCAHGRRLHAPGRRARQCAFGRAAPIAAAGPVRWCAIPPSSSRRADRLAGCGQRAGRHRRPCRGDARQDADRGRTGWRCSRSSTG